MFSHFDEQTGKQKDRSTGYANREDAEAELENFLRQRRSIRMGLAVDHKEYTVAQVLDDYAHFKMGEPSAARLSYSMEHLLNYWGDQTVDYVNVETISAYLKRGKKEGRAQSTIRRELIDLRSAINHAVNMNRVLPVKFPKLPKDSPPKERWIDEREFALLLRAAGEDYRAKFTLRLFLIIAFYTGARKSAIMELEWNQIDFKRNTIDFNKNYVQSSNKKRAFIPMPPQVRWFLLLRFNRYGDRSAYVFHQKHKPDLRVKSIDKSFRAAAKRAKLNDVTPHTLRHSRISLLLQRGEVPINVSNYVKVSQPTIDKVYGHHSNTDLQEMARRIGRTQNVRTS